MGKIRLIYGGEDHWEHRLRYFRRPLYSIDEMTVLVCTILGPAYIICLITGV